MQVAKNTVVTVYYELFDEDNELIDKPEEPMSYLHGGYGDIFPLVEEALEGKKVGDLIDVDLSVDDAFGEIEEELVREEKLDVFPTDVEVGMMFETDDPETDEVMVFRVVDIADGKAVVDANHPLAGVKIRFKATIADIRAASADEVQHGHAHGAHGHHH